MDNAPPRCRGADGGAFRPAWWAANRHAQTLWHTVVRPAPRLARTNERLELADGDFLDLCWGPPRPGPVVLLLHGLGGCAQSPYVIGLQKALAERGMGSVAMQYRGAAGIINRLPRFYHAGAFDDAESVAKHVRRVMPDRAVAAVGFSLGGAILLNWLGTRGGAAPISAAVAVSVPFDLAACAEAINKGAARIYERHLLGILKGMYQRKFRERPADAPISLREAARLPSLRAFDNAITAPLHGFADVDAYYGLWSPKQRLKMIHTPTRIIHAEDDPFIPPTAIPGETDLSEAVCLELSAGGGHVGFVHGAAPWRPEYWIEQRVPHILRDILAAQADDSGERALHTLPYA